MNLINGYKSKRPFPRYNNPADDDDDIDENETLKDETLENEILKNKTEKEIHEMSIFISPPNTIDDYIDAITDTDIYKELDIISSEYSLGGTNKGMRASITAYLTANLFMGNYDRDEVNIFCEIMRNSYIPGTLSVEACYNQYYQDRKIKIKKKSIITQQIHEGAYKDVSSNTSLSTVAESKDVIPTKIITHNELLEIDQVKDLVEKITGNKFVPIEGRQILFEGMHPKGYKLILLTPKSKFYETYGSWWIDINKSLRTIIERYKDGFFIMRLEKNKFCCFYWSEIVNYLTEKCKVYDKKSGELWRMYIYPTYIKIWQNEKFFYVQVKEVDEIVSILTRRLSK